MAAINKGTAQKLQALGFKAEFIGEGRDTTGIGNQFGEVAANGTVLFPQSSISLRSIQQQLSEKVECIDLIVYSTNSKEEFNLKGFSSLVFTSPSNVQAALESGGWDKNASLIAIGHTTEKALLEAGYADVKVAWTPSELALADLIAS